MQKNSALTHLGTILSYEASYENVFVENAFEDHVKTRRMKAGRKTRINQYSASAPKILPIKERKSKNRVSASDGTNTCPNFHPTLSSNFENTEKKPC